MKRTIIFLLAVFALSGTTGAQSPCFMQSSTPWADQTIETMSLDEQIGQLFMVAAWSDPKNAAYDPQSVQTLISKYGVGGVIFMQGSPGRQAKLTNQYQSSAKVPLMIAMDAEWGLGMRLDSTIAYPRQLTLGASGNDSLIYDFGVEMARQLKRLGVHISFSPVVDINNNAKNPVISNRSFGENKLRVTSNSLMYMHGLQDNGILACAKHFPGHGDTDVDSHKDLPVVAHPYERIDTLELYPYKYLIHEGLGSVMTAHLYVPSLDTSSAIASTLSRQVITDLLRGKMGFEGLVFTDAMNMQGIAKFFKPGEAEVKALMAGNDVLLFSQNIPLAIEKIKMAVDSGYISTEEIKMHCLRILRAKEWMGVNKRSQVEFTNLNEDLNNHLAVGLRKKLVEESITVLKNENGTLPLSAMIGKKVAVVSVGVENESEFASTLRHYVQFDHFNMEKSPEFKKAMWWHDTLAAYDYVISALLNTSNKASKNFGVTNEACRIMNSVGENSNVILTVFANPYAVEVLKDMSNIESVIVSYQDDPMTQQVSAEIIAGAIGADGVLPVTACQQFPVGSGYSTPGGDKLRWNYGWYANNVATPADHTGNPAGDYEEDMMGDGSSHGKAISIAMDKIDAIAESGITSGAYPGCRVLVAKTGTVVYDKAFGNLDYESKEKVTESTVYDLASITKVASSTIAAMKLVDQGKLDVNKKLGDYLTFPAGNAYADVVIKNMLSHCAGFTAWIPFYQKTITKGSLDAKVYRTQPEPGFTSQVADGIFIMDSYRDSIFNQIIQTPLSSDKSYKYSDLGYYFMQRIVEKQSGQSLDVFVSENFYQPMGLSSIGYQPLKRMKSNSIAPTENDKTFRTQHIRGHVHDQGAAMMGGVAGHAGLFSTAQDLAAIMQMLMDHGVYGGKQYISKETISLFNTRHFSGNRRGLGFDKPSLSPGHGSTCKEASAASFGHTGFTGTMCWADPESGLVYIFLSNRVNPDAENKKLQDLNIRTDIQEEIYKVWGK
ncbi:MAG: serine hydrolase [Flavobacteriales bacterium]|nr:serine hydrolase [Flavobacteriales bacterium]